MHARVEIFPPQKPGTNLLAGATIHFQGEFPVIIKGFRILNGKYGPWLAWPQRSTNQKDENGKTKYVSVAWSEDENFRKELQALAVASYNSMLQQGAPQQPQQNYAQQPQAPQYGAPAPGYNQPPQPQYPQQQNYAQPPQQSPPAQAPGYAQPPQPAPPAPAPAQAPDGGGYAPQPNQAPPAPPTQPQSPQNPQNSQQPAPNNNAWG